MAVSAKPFTKQKIIIYLTFAAIIILSVYLFVQTDNNLKSANFYSNYSTSLSIPLPQQFSSWNVRMNNIENFTIYELSRGNVQNSEVIDILAKRGEEVFWIKRITNLETDVASSLINDRQTQLKSLFEPERSPYFEDLTNKVVCPDEFKPIYNQSSSTRNQIKYYILYANERFGFGVCSKDLIKYRGIVAFAYCNETKELYELKYFISIQEYSKINEETIRSFSC